MENSFICKQCEKTFYLRKSIISSRNSGGYQIKYCSSGCRDKGRRTGEYIKCGYCGKLFYRTKSGSHIKCCSKSCGAFLNPRRYWLGKKHSQETIQKVKEAKIKQWREDSEYRRKVLCNRSPNKSEIKLFNIIQELFTDEYKLNVNGDVLILGGKIPDIVNVNGRKKLIELFGDYWHTEVHTYTPKERVDYFNNLGWKSLIIWYEELKEKNLDSLKQKLLEFHYGGLPLNF